MTNPRTPDPVPQPLPEDQGGSGLGCTGWSLLILGILLAMGLAVRIIFRFLGIEPPA